MRKKFVCLLLIIIFVLTTFTGPCFGLDLSKDVIPISSIRDLDALHQAIIKDYNHNLRNKKFVLVKDIKGFCGSIGNSGFPFISEFDGCGHTIELKDSNGLFYSICGGTVKNLVVKGTVFGSGQIGGVVVRASDGTRIINCTNYATVTSSYPVAGGIAGLANKSGLKFEEEILDDKDSTIIIENCANYGTINAPSFAGAICGKLTHGKDGYSEKSTLKDIVLKNCYFGGSVNGEVIDDQTYIQLNEALSRNPEYLPWIDKDNDGIPELNYSFATKYTGSIFSNGSIILIAAIMVAAGIACFILKKKKNA